MRATRKVLCNSCGDDINEGTAIKELRDKHYQANFHATSCPVPSTRCPDCMRLMRVCEDCKEDFDYEKALTASEGSNRAVRRNTKRK